LRPATQSAKDMHLIIAGPALPGPADSPGEATELAPGDCGDDQGMADQQLTPLPPFGYSL
jgi:hypothetical protein